MGFWVDKCHRSKFMHRHRFKEQERPQITQITQIKEQEQLGFWAGKCHAPNARHRYQLKKQTQKKSV